MGRSWRGTAREVKAGGGAWEGPFPQSPIFIGDWQPAAPSGIAYFFFGAGGVSSTFTGSSPSS